jgi:hypothetical protein
VLSQCGKTIVSSRDFRAIVVQDLTEFGMAVGTT